MCLYNTVPVTIPGTIGYKLVRKTKFKDIYGGFYSGNCMGLTGLGEPVYEKGITYIAGKFSKLRKELTYRCGFHAYSSLKEAIRQREYLLNKVVFYDNSTKIVKVLLEEVHTTGYDNQHNICYVGNKQLIIEEV